MYIDMHGSVTALFVLVVWYKPMFRHYVTVHVDRIVSLEFVVAVACVVVIVGSGWWVVGSGQWAVATDTTNAPATISTRRALPIPTQETLSTFSDCWGGILPPTTSIWPSLLFCL